MSNSFLITVGLILFLTAVLLVRAFCALATQYGVLAVPNERSSHNVTTPHGGGIVFVLLWLCFLLLTYFSHLISIQELLLFLPSTFVVAFVGFWDDVKELPARKRLIAQVIATFYALFMLGDASLLHLSRYTTFFMGGFGFILTALGIIWSINLYNFMDGLDGLAAVEAVFVFGVGGFFFWNIGVFPMALLAWAIVLTVAGFLVWNWPTARVFMGDAGSYFLGFLVGLFSVVGDRLYHIPITVWIILYSVFWFDTTVTLFRRLFKGENVALAHREQAIHRLHRAGYSHTQVLWGVIFLNSALSLLAIWALKTDSFKWGFGLTLLLLSAVYFKIEKIKPMFHESNPNKKS